MKYIEPLYLSAGIKDPGYIKYRLKIHAGCPGLYVITLSRRSDELFHIYHDSEFQHKPVRLFADEMTVVGLARGYFASRLLIGEILNDIYAHTGTYDVKAFFAAKAAEGSM